MAEASSPSSLRAVRDRVIALDAQSQAAGKGRLSVDIDSNRSGNFPWGWWLRDLRIGFIDMKLKGYRPQSQLLFVSVDANPDLIGAGVLNDYKGKTYRLRSFWIPDKKGLSPAALWRYMRHRKQWGPLIHDDAWIYTRPNS
jgi:hypothetical protein